MVKIFLHALKTQSLRAQKTVLKIIVLYNDSKNTISNVNSVYAVNLLDIIFTFPVVSFVNIKKRLKTKSYQTIYNVLAKFVKVGILEDVSGRKRNRIFVFKQLLDSLK